MTFIKFITIIILTFPLLHASQVANKIKQSEKRLQSAEQRKRLMNMQLSKIAESIKKTEREYAKIEKILDDLRREKKRNQQLYKTAKERVSSLDQNISKLNKEIRSNFEQFLKILTDQFAVIAASERLHQTTPKSVIQQEIYETFKKENDKRLKYLKREIDKNRLEKIKMAGERNGLRKSIAEIERKRRLYQQKKREKVKLLRKLAKQESIYKKRLRHLITRQNLLRLTLAKLNILKKQEIEEAQRRERERQAELERRAKELEKMRIEKEKERQTALAEGKEVDYTPVTLKETKKVKQYGSSYHKDKIYNYRGPKTISPIKGARVVKKFGTYIDPIYKIKIFNESVTLKAPQKNAKVRNVLNGKVVFVGKNSMLGKVVIVSHPNKLHTVYAGLSRISPLIKNGSKIKRGAIIGKVKNKLLFEATKNSMYINPLKLIILR